MNILYKSNNINMIDAILKVNPEISFIALIVRPNKIIKIHNLDIRLISIELISIKLPPIKLI